VASRSYAHTPPTFRPVWRESANVVDHDLKSMFTNSSRSEYEEYHRDDEE